MKVPEFLMGTIATSLDGRPYPPLRAGYRKIIDPAFSYMVLGEYPPQGEAQLISRMWVEQAVERYKQYAEKHGDIPPNPGIRPIMGLDMAEFGGDNNAACLRYSNFVARIFTWMGIDTDSTVKRALEIYRTHNVSIAMVDATGVGNNVAPAMARLGRDDPDPVRAMSVKVASSPSKAIKTELGEFYMLRDQLWWAVREWLRTDQNAMLPPDPYLIEELCLPTYEYREVGGKIKIMSKDRMRDLLRRSPDRSDALCLTFSPFSRPTIIKLSAR